jgi:aldehyde dehydrogenase (NAD+)
MCPEPGAAADILEGLRHTVSSGRTRDLAWRHGQLDALERLLLHERPRIEQALRDDLGKPPAEAFLAEVYGACQEVRGLRRGLRRWSRPEGRGVPWALWPSTASVRHDPLGIVLIVGPWNYPLNLALVPLAAALSAGNAAVVKPSEHAPATSRLLADVVPRYLDPEAVAVVQGGPEATEALIDGGVDHVFFTGSARVGRLVMERAARHLTPVTLELGGKCPAVVAADADLAVAARRIAWGKFMNAGQSCIAPDYVLVEASAQGPLLDLLCRMIGELYGEDPAKSPDYGRIVNESHLDRLAGLLADHGGEIVAGGSVDRDRRYVAPTIVRDPSTTSVLMDEEIFGPVLPVLAIDDLGAAARFVNERPPPLALYVFTSDTGRAERLLDETRSGSACVNTTMEQFAATGLPFGGVGPSGSGRYHGRSGFETFSNPRAVLLRPVHPDLPWASAPYSGWRARAARQALALSLRLRAPRSR